MIRRLAERILKHRTEGEALERHLIAAIRAEADKPGQSAKLFAESIGISQQYLSDIIHERRTVSSGVLRLIVDSGKAQK